MNLTNVLILAH